MANVSDEDVTRMNQAIGAVYAAAVRYVAAQEAHAARDWATFKAMNLAAVSIEYERLKAAVEACEAIGVALNRGSGSEDGNA